MRCGALCVIECPTYHRIIILQAAALPVPVRCACVAQLAVHHGIISLLRAGPPSMRTLESDLWTGHGYGHCLHNQQKTLSTHTFFVLCILLFHLDLHLLLGT